MRPHTQEFSLVRTWQSLLVCVCGCFKILHAYKRIILIEGCFLIECCSWYYVIGRSGKTNMIFLMNFNTTFEMYVHVSMYHSIQCLFTVKFSLIIRILNDTLDFSFIVRICIRSSVAVSDPWEYYIVKNFQQGLASGCFFSIGSSSNIFFLLFYSIIASLYTCSQDFFFSLLIDLRICKIHGTSEACSDCFLKQCGLSPVCLARCGTEPLVAGYLSIISLYHS